MQTADPCQAALVEVLGVKVRAYAPRDVINAPAIKAAIARRSRERQDPPEVAHWLANHWFRHVVANFVCEAPALVRVESAEQARVLFTPLAVPIWVREGGIKGSVNRLWIDPEGAQLLALEAKLLEFLGSRQGTPLHGKLQRITCPQALALWAAEHAAFEARAAVGWREHQPDAVRTCWQGSLGCFVEFRPDSLKLREEMAFESQMMRHCLGQFSDRRQLRGGYGEHYASACEAGTLRLFSFRGANGQPHITISAVVQDDGRLRIDQIKGKHNRPPVARYLGEVLGFLATLDCTLDHTRTTPPDALAMGLIRLPRGWSTVTAELQPDDQVFIAHRYLESFRALSQPCVLAQWIVAARAPEQLMKTGAELHPCVAHALEGAR